MVPHRISRCHERGPPCGDFRLRRRSNSRAPRLDDRQCFVHLAPNRRHRLFNLGLDDCNLFLALSLKINEELRDCRDVHAGHDVLGVIENPFQISRRGV